MVEERASVVVEDEERDGGGWESGGSTEIMTGQGSLSPGWEDRGKSSAYL